eukprot:4775151-Pyramimonas_sp.AAC.1
MQPRTPVYERRSLHTYVCRPLRPASDVALTWRGRGVGASWTRRGSGRACPRSTRWRRPSRALGESFRTSTHPLGTASPTASAPNIHRVAPNIHTIAPRQ